MPTPHKHYSIVIPAYNEEGAIGAVLEALLRDMKDVAEIVVVNDCSKDGTLAEAKKYPVTVLSNVQNFGYGYSLKRGIAAATNDHIVILDADGSYPIAALRTLMKEYEKGFDMVVGSRTGVHYRSTLVKSIARFFFRALSEFATGRTIPDINSGCRIFRKDAMMRFASTLSSGFSFTTTITLAFMLNAYSVQYVPIEYHKRHGKSKVRYVRDTLRSLQIITESIILYNPIKMFLLCGFFILLSGIVSGIVAYFFPLYGILLFLTLAFAMLVLALGFLAVLLRFMPNRQAHDV
jgi:glycosyltransferase involved in cell wall biosynthesis